MGVIIPTTKYALMDFEPASSDEFDTPMDVALEAYLFVYFDHWCLYK